MKCITPADVYTLLKGSDFVCHDVDPQQVFDGCIDGVEDHQLELVLRKWFDFDTSREMRCFVRRELLIGEPLAMVITFKLMIDRLGISQRDDNHYDYLNVQETQDKVCSTIKTFWERDIKGKWEAGGDCASLFLTARRALP